MEQIKKYNYRDPLHQKGDPFGATEAKVAHVNDVISEVNSIDSRVTALENAPAPEAATEYYINGAIIHFPDGSFVVTVDSHNTPVRNIPLTVPNTPTFENVFGFSYSSNGFFGFYVQNSMVTANLGNEDESCQIINAVISSVIINPEPRIGDAFSATGKPYVSTTIIPYVQTDIINEGFIADLSIYMLNMSQDPTTKIVTLDTVAIPGMPPPSSSKRIFNFQLKFSSFEVVRV